MRIILYIIVFMLTIIVIIGVRPILIAPHTPTENRIESFQSKEAHKLEMMGATQAEIMIQCAGKFIIYVDDHPIVTNFTSQPEKMFSQDIYLFSSSTIDICICNPDQPVSGFIGAIMVGQFIYPFHIGKGPGAVSCLGEMAVDTQIQEFNKLKENQYSGGQYEGCFALPNDITETNYHQGSYTKQGVTYLIQQLSKPDTNGTIALAHRTALQNKKDYYGIFTTTDNTNWVIFGNSSISSIARHQDHPKCVSSCSSNAREKCGGTLSSQGTDIIYAQCYSAKNPPTLKTIKNKKLTSQLDSHMPSGPEWLWIKEGPPHHQSQNWWRFSIFNPMSTSNHVCIYPQYSEFLPTACRDPLTAQSCKNSLHPGYVADDDSCISHYKPPKHFDTVAWRSKFDRAFHNFNHTKQDVFDQQDSIKIAFQDYFERLFQLNISILREDNQHLVADVLSHSSKEDSLENRCQRVQPQDREAVSYIEPGLKMCSAAGSPECDMLRTQCLDDGYCFDDLHPTAPKCYQPAPNLDTDIIDNDLVPNFNKSLTLASRAAKKPHLIHSPTVILWKEYIKEFVRLVRILEFMDDDKGCPCLSSEDSCHPC
jgi:hypothetical protein